MTISTMSEVSLFGQSWFGHSYCGEVFGCNVAVKTVGESSIFTVMYILAIT